MADPKDDEHIEELLSELQGIFGKLSNADEAEARQKVDVPVTPPAPRPTPPPPTPVAVPEPPVIASAPVLPPAPQAPVATPEPPPAAAPVGAPANAVIEPPAQSVQYGEGTLTTAIFYAAGRDKEAQVLKQKAEALTPKFTKVSFKLQVILMMPYEPKTEWREGAIQRLKDSQIHVFFLLGDRPMEDAKRRQIQADTEPLKIYFQEVTLPSLEKKAFFTDLLLGLVFFFDSLKPKTPGE